jgi:hypothetical protein
MGDHLVRLASDQRLEPVLQVLGRFTTDSLARFGRPIEAMVRGATPLPAASAGRQRHQRGAGKLMAVMAISRAGS